MECWFLLTPRSSVSLRPFSRSIWGWVERARLDLSRLREAHAFWKTAPAPHHVAWWFVFIDSFFFLKGEISIFAIWSKFARLKAKLTPRAQEIFSSLENWIYASTNQLMVVLTPPIFSNVQRIPSSLSGASSRA